MRFKSKKNNLKNLNSLKEISIRKFIKNKLAVAGLVIITIITLLSVCAPFLTSYQISQSDLYNIRSAPSAQHILGTDDIGRDVFTRLLYGGRISIAVGIASMVVQLIVGVTLGAVAGYYGGIIDKIVIRIIDIIMCFPFFVIALALSSVLGGSIENLILIIGLLMWPGIARIVRGEIFSLKENDYIMAARALGLSPREIIVQHLLPNIMSPILVASTLSIANGILMEAALSFLGLGVKPPAPSWGNMLVAAQNMATIQNEWWLWIPAGLMIVLIVLSINFLGDGLRNALDPQIKL